MATNNKDQIRLTQLYSVCRKALDSTGFEDISTVDLLKGAVGLVTKTRDKSGLIDLILEELLDRDIEKEIIFADEDDATSAVSASEILAIAVKILAASEQKEETQKSLSELKEEIASNKAFEKKKSVKSKPSAVKKNTEPEPDDFEKVFVSPPKVVTSLSEMEETKIKRKRC